MAEENLIATGWRPTWIERDGAFKAGADAHTAIVAPIIAEAQAAGAKSLRQIAAALNARGIATARGGKWEAQTVANIMRRVG